MWPDLQNLASVTSRRARRRPRGGSSGCGIRCRTAWSANCACAAFAPSRPRRPYLASHHRFNHRFGKPPADRQAVWRRPPRDPPSASAAATAAWSPRDNTVRLGPRVVQLRGARSYARLTVDVRELLDGRCRSCTTRSSVARRRRPAPRSSSNHAARERRPPGRVASVALGRSRSACPGWPQHAHWPSTARHPSLRGAQAGPPIRLHEATNREDVFTSQRRRSH